MWSKYATAFSPSCYEHYHNICLTYATVKTVAHSQLLRHLFPRWYRTPNQFHKHLSLAIQQLVHNTIHPLKVEACHRVSPKVCHDSKLNRFQPLLDLALAHELSGKILESKRPDALAKLWNDLQIAPITPIHTSRATIWRLWYSASCVVPFSMHISCQHCPFYQMEDHSVGLDMLHTVQNEPYRCYNCAADTMAHPLVMHLQPACPLVVCTGLFSLVLYPKYDTEAPTWADAEPTSSNWFAQHILLKPLLVTIPTVLTTLDWYLHRTPCSQLA